jgi:hypothetical protein
LPSQLADWSPRAWARSRRFSTSAAIYVAIHAERFDIAAGAQKVQSLIQEHNRTHAEPDGVVLVELWFSPDAWENGRLTADLS